MPNRQPARSAARITAPAIDTAQGVTWRHVVTLAGIVRDAATDAPLVGAQVLVSAGARTWRATSRADGSYVFVDLPDGAYRLTATAARYTPTTSEPITVKAARDAAGRPTFTTQDLRVSRADPSAKEP